LSSVALRDEPARQQVVQDLDTCILVEAGAGSGKTSSLVARMVALIREGRCRTETLAAITFTRKAAQELRGRFQVAMEKALTGEVDAVKRERLSSGLDELDRCFLGTVHSFCAAILRERPIEANLEPDFQELDERDDAILLDRAWDEYLGSVHDARPEQLEGLQELGVDTQDLRDCYQALSTYPDVEVVRDPVPRPDLSAVRQELHNLLDWVEQVIPEEVPAKGWDGLQELLRTALQRRRVFSLDDDIVLLRLLADLDRSGGITQNRWRCADDAKQAKNRFEAFKSDSLASAIRQWREYRHARLIDFVMPAIEHCEGLKRDKSRLNYQDLLMGTAKLLGENPELRAYFQDRYTHLLVDEFQDTDPIQAEIMFYLTGQDQNEQDWRKLHPRPGALFVVGDPKQSIYRFRRADIDTYNEVKRLILASGGAVLHLTTNFRSVDTLGVWVNPVFRTLLTEDETRFQAAFEGLETVRGVNEDCHCGLQKISIPKVERNKASEIAKIDADRIAAWISQALSGGLSLSRTAEELRDGLTGMPRPGDFLILMRYRANMDIYASALESRGIPYQIAGGTGFSQSPELFDLLKLLRMLLDPGDPVRFLAVLRGSLFGISDSQFYRFKKAGGEFHLDSAIPEGLDADDGDVFDWAFEQLRRFRNWTQDLPVSAALESIMSELGSIPAALTGELGRSRAGYLMQCLELLADAERKGTTSLAGLVEYLSSLVEAGIEEEIDIAPGESNYVRIMNLHKAKGLEAAVVFLANPAKNAFHIPTVHICRTDGSPRGYFVIEKRKEYASEVLAQPAGWDAYCKTEQQYLSAEENRLLYVAATRAKDLLVVSAYEGKPEISPWNSFEAHLTDVPELEVCGDDEETAGAEEGMGLGAGDFDQARAGIKATRRIINAASYSHVPVTSFVEEKGLAPSRVVTRRGQSWGNVIHRLLDACARGKAGDIEVIAGNALIEERRSPKEVPRVLREVRRVLDSPLWKRVLSSGLHYSEVPFYIDSKIGKPEDAGEDTVISGTIDLVFKEGSGWAIVDFKTDTVSGEPQLASLVSYYAPQLEMYRKAWENVVGEPVDEVGLYFTSINKLVVTKSLTEKKHLEKLESSTEYDRPCELQPQTPLHQGKFLQIGDTAWEIEPQVEVVATNWSDCIEEILDEECCRIVANFVEKVIRFPDHVGFELVNDRGEVIAEAEVAWEQEMVALLRADQQEFREVFDAAGWKVFMADSGIVAEIEEALSRS
jgi:ATP-dependent helicase/nuclease subunit A